MANKLMWTKSTEAPDIVPLLLGFACWMISAAGLASLPTMVSGTQPIPSYSPAEQWILKQVAAGNIADLAQRFPEAKDRIVRAQFLEDLITGNNPDIQITRQGVRIVHAQFIEPLDLHNAVVTHEVWLTECLFKRSVDLSHSTFHRPLWLGGSVFKDTANFTAAHIAELDVNTASFNRNAHFDGMEVAPRVRIVVTVFR